MSPCPWAGWAQGAGAGGGCWHREGSVRAGLPRAWDGWVWAQGCPRLTPSRLSSLMLREEGLREMTVGLLVFA